MNLALMIVEMMVNLYSFGLVEISEIFVIRDVFFFSEAGILNT